MKKSITFLRTLVFGISFLFVTAVNADIVSFTGDNTSGTGSVDGTTFAWSATPGLVNDATSSEILRWGLIGNPSSTGFDFTITMIFPNDWIFKEIEFSGLNTDQGHSSFKVQMLDSLKHRVK